MSVDANIEFRVSFEQGTLLLEPPSRRFLDEDLGFVYDARVKALRTEAYRYRQVIEHLLASGLDYHDDARKYSRLTDLIPRRSFSPYDHQDKALAAWKQADMAGVVVLPTGSGKTYLAMMAMHECRRPTLVVVPTLDLVSQWVRVIEAVYPIQAGIIGGGEFTTRDVTVITYDSAVRHVDHLGNRFGLVVFDECHHLPGEMYSEIARMSLAPFRLGLTATPERSDGSESLLDDLVGGIVFSSRVSALAGNILAPYETRRITVPLSPQEDEEYRAAREHYLGFCRQQGVRLGDAGGWTDFLRKTARSRAGREAFAAYRHQRNIPLTCAAKFQALAELLVQHRQDRIIVFTHINELAYKVSRQYLIPVITHQTPTRERAKILDHFASGIYPAVVTSRVLNEGVDVPEANVAIILSGSGSIREHVQRLGRILRQQEGKRAMLYELVAEHTHEHGMSVRRTRHEAYRKQRRGR